MPDRIALVVNPRATRARAGLTRRVQNVLGPAGLAEVLTTERAGHAAELAKQAVARGATIVAVVGGDGTANEVAQGLCDTAAALLPIPAGSTNVFARALGWAHPADRALQQLPAALERREVRDVRLGRVIAGAVDRIFCVNVGVGVDADTIHLVEAHPWIKTRFRNLGVTVATAVAVVRGRGVPPALTVVVDGGEPFAAGSLIAACGSPYAFVGRRPLDLVPGADFGERLRWITIGSNRAGRVAATGLGAIRNAGHMRLGHLTNGWAGDAIEVTAPFPVAVQADGEPLGWHTRVRLQPGPHLQTIVP